MSVIQMFPNNFIKKIDDGVWQFRELWFDRCIDRQGEYIPFFPYWLDRYTPKQWVKEGFEICNIEACEFTEKVRAIFKENSIEIIKSEIFNTEFTDIPEEEAGCAVYSVDNFLSLNHKEVGYEGYVFYGATFLTFKTNKSMQEIADLIAQR